MVAIFLRLSHQTRSISEFINILKICGPIQDVHNGLQPGCDSIWSPLRIDFGYSLLLCLQTAEALPEVAAAAASSPDKKLIFPPDTSAIKEASLILMRDKSGSKPTLVRVSECVVPGLSRCALWKSH